MYCDRSVNYVEPYHGRSQGQSFTEASMSITPRLGIFIKLVYGNLTSCPYLISAGGISGGCNTV